MASKRTAKGGKVRNCWMAIDRWGFSHGGLWQNRNLLREWLKRKYPASWRLHRIGRFEVRELPRKAVK